MSLPMQECCAKKQSGESWRSAAVRSYSRTTESLETRTRIPWVIHSKTSRSALVNLTLTYLLACKSQLLKER